MSDELPGDYLSTAIIGAAREKDVAYGALSAATSKQKEAEQRSGEAVETLKRAATGRKGLPG